jgi:gamma-glutamyltranspeptidase / glutathione hydrolase
MAEASWVPATSRPVIMGSKYMISAGHYLAAWAGAQVLEAGGNAVDAGVAAGLCLNVLQTDMCNLGGVAPICIFRAGTGTVETISGLGWWPAATDPEIFRSRYGGRIGSGIHSSVIPAAADAWLTALESYGTISFAAAARTATELAEDGFPMHSVMLQSFEKWPRTREVFARPDGSVPRLGELVRQKELGRTLRLLADAEHGAQTRADGIRAARHRFYSGDIAEAMVKHSDREGGWLTMEDLASFRVEVEAPVSVNYCGYDVHACGPWCQGPVVPMTLNILKGYDIGSMAPRSSRLHHIVLEALKAAFADRERYFGDPRYVQVPIDGLLAEDYGAQWRSRIKLSSASPGMPVPGDPWRHSALSRPDGDDWRMPIPAAGSPRPDTTYVCVVDGEGNAFSATPSDGVSPSLHVSELGFSLSERGAQSWLDPDHPSAVGPGRRPRLTPSPGMVTQNGNLVMPFGTPGGDVQPQAMVQFLLNVVNFGMNVQAAMEEPRCATYSFPLSSDPHSYAPGSVNIESRVGPDVIDSLRELGHVIEPWPAWTGTAGSLGAIYVDRASGVLHGAADPRRIAYAIGR